MDGGSDLGTCEPPATVTYDCDPEPAGSVGCSGSPTYYGTAVPDPEAVFAEGCRISLPFCNPYYPSFVADCQCRDDTSTGPIWICPL